MLRSISRSFSSSRGKNGNSDDSSSKLSWDLDNINFHEVLYRFYTEFNPERVSVIEEILNEFRGHEIELLQELCSRYELSQDDMQKIVDKGRIKIDYDDESDSGSKKSAKKNSGNGKKAVQRFSRFMSPFGRKQKQNASGGGNTDDQSSIDNQNEDGASFSTDKKTAFETSSFSWVLKGVDLEPVLVGFYKKFNPDKVHLVTRILQEFAGDEVVMLRELCERYELSESDMQVFINLGSSAAKSGQRGKNQQEDSRKNKLSFRNIVRAVSPFTSKGSQEKKRQNVSDEEDTESDAVETMDTTPKPIFKWNLHGADLGEALKVFYHRFNPERVELIDQILGEFKGDEEAMFEELCNRYELSYHDMQTILDNSIRIKSKSVVKSKATASIIRNRANQVKASGSFSETSSTYESPAPVKGTISQMSSGISQSAISVDLPSLSVGDTEQYSNSNDESMTLNTSEYQSESDSTSMAPLSGLQSNSRKAMQQRPVITQSVVRSTIQNNLNNAAAIRNNPMSAYYSNSSVGVSVSENNDLSMNVSNSTRAVNKFSSTSVGSQQGRSSQNLQQKDPTFMPQPAQYSQSQSPGRSNSNQRNGSQSTMYRAILNTGSSSNMSQSSNGNQYQQQQQPQQQQQHYQQHPQPNLSVRNVHYPGAVGPAIATIASRPSSQSTGSVTNGLPHFHDGSVSARERDLAHLVNHKEFEISNIKAELELTRNELKQAAEETKEVLNQFKSLMSSGNGHPVSREALVAGQGQSLAHHAGSEQFHFQQFEAPIAAGMRGSSPSTFLASHNNKNNSNNHNDNASRLQRMNSETNDVSMGPGLPPTSASASLSTAELKLAVDMKRKVKGLEKELKYTQQTVQSMHSDKQDILKLLEIIAVSGVQGNSAAQRDLLSNYLAKHNGSPSQSVDQSAGEATGSSFSNHSVIGPPPALFIDDASEIASVDLNDRNNYDSYFNFNNYNNGGESSSVKRDSLRKNVQGDVVLSQEEFRKIQEYIGGENLRTGTSGRTLSSKNSDMSPSMSQATTIRADSRERSNRSSGHRDREKGKNAMLEGDVTSISRELLRANSLSPNKRLHYSGFSPDDNSLTRRSPSSGINAIHDANKSLEPYRQYTTSAVIKIMDPDDEIKMQPSHDLRVTSGGLLSPIRKENKSPRRYMNINSEAVYNRPGASASRDPSPSVFKQQWESMVNTNNSNAGDGDRNVMTSQYELAKKYLNMAAAQSQSNADELRAQEILLHQQQQQQRRHGSNSSRSSRSDSRTGSRSQSNSKQSYNKSSPGNEFPNDWTKSFDPKTQRIYYYSKSRKVSSWTLPADVHPDHLSETSGPLDSVAHSSVSRSSSNSSRHRRSESPMLFGRGATSSQSQSPSPPFGTNEMLRASSASSHSTRSRSPAVGGTRGTWIKAFDQRTERFYWYNRETRQSSWLNPMETTQ